MRFHIADVHVNSGKRLEIIDVTREMQRVAEESGIQNGLVNMWTLHTTAAIAVNEHDTDLWEDILRTFEQLVPINGNYRHNAKYGWSSGEQNAHAHILNCMIKPDITIPVVKGRIQLGTWQSVLFIELDGPRSRSIRVQVMGE